MKYQRILPSKRIEPVIEFFWDFQGDFSKADYHHSATASINPKLAFQYQRGMRVERGGKSEQLFTSGFQCQTKSFYQISTSQKSGVFGISFKPYAIPLLFNIPSTILTDQNVEIADLLGKEGKILEEQVLNCENTPERVATITTFIESKLKKTRQQNGSVVSAVNSILANKRYPNMMQLAEAHCLSQRQFERRFKELTGFSPKLFSRIMRFQECIGRAYGPPLSLTELGLLSGYYDQSHMIRDFKEFTGKIPTQYFIEDHSLFLK